VEDRISGLDDEIDIKEKQNSLTKDERNTQELTDSIKRPNLANCGHQRRRRSASQRDM
jgi:FtsZ-binding cell division protein ZapB